MIRALLAACLLLAGCGNATVATPAPPKVSVDQQMAQWLLTVQEGITAAEALVPANPELKPVLNKIIVGYNAAESSYLLYHSAVGSGTPADATALTAQIQQLLASIGSIQSLYAK